jgi:hypothetical protein
MIGQARRRPRACAGLSVGGAATLGFLYVAPGAGALPGALLLARLLPGFRKQRTPPVHDVAAS